MKDSLISVIIPIHNAQKFINECVDSLLNQSYEPIEIILVDDGSTDMSGIICDDYASYHSSIKVIHQENKGRTHARIVGLNNAAGDYITFVDSDDYVDSTYIEYLARCLFENDVDISCCGYYIDVNNHNYTLERTEYGCFGKKAINRILSKNFLFDDRTATACFPLYLWGKLFKKENLHLALSKGKDLWFGEDIVTLFYLLHHTNSICISKEPHYYYRFHEEQTIKNNGRERWGISIKLFQTLDELDQKKELRDQLPLYILVQLMGWLKVSFLNSDGFGEFRADMYYAINNDIIENCFIHKKLATSNKRYKIHAFLIKKRLYLLYYLTLKVHSFIKQQQRKE